MPGEPLYRQVKRALLTAIAAGKYETGKPFVTQRELCARFGVSNATAIKALNDLVAEGHLVRQRGRGTFVAERPESQPSNEISTISCILQHHGPHVSKLLIGIETAAAELGHRVVLRHCEGDPAREEQALRQALDQHVDGIIVYPAEGDVPASSYAEAKHRRTPLVMVDRYRADLATDAVIADNFAVGQRLTDELLAHGHERIATLWDEIDVTSVRDRLAGHLHSLHAHGITRRPQLTVLQRYSKKPVDERRQTIADLMRGKHQPTVFLCANGYVLAEAAQDLATLGYDIPRDVDLAGMDDAGPFDVLPLTAAAAVLPSRELGDRAMRLLHERITTDNLGPEQIVLPIEIRTRKSAPAHLQVVGAASP